MGRAPPTVTPAPRAMDSIPGFLGNDDADVHDVIARLREIWLEATPDSISGDLERARTLARMAPPAEAAHARRYLEAIRRLERWLHDL